MRKMDEMEMAITLKAIRIAWFYTVVFLFVWSSYSGYKSFKEGSFIANPASFLLISQNIILLSAQIYYKRKMTKDGE